MISGEGNWMKFLLEINDEKIRDNLVAVLRALPSVTLVDFEDDHFYSPENLEAIDRSLRQIEEGKTVEKTLDELRAMEEE
jgi:hypothetical protein